MKRTEEEMLALLKRRFREDRGNGPAWAFVPKVRNAAGFSATRTLDALAMSLWPSRGLELHGFEIKCSRSDWLRELDKPEKADAFFLLLDRWWIVVADESIVQGGELPPTWGLLVARGQRLVQTVAADVLPPLPDGVEKPWSSAGRSFIAALLRAAVRTQEVTPEEIAAAVKLEGERWKARMEQEHEHLERRLADRDERLTAFEQASGLRLGPVNGGPPDGYFGHYAADEIGRAVKLVLSGEHDVGVMEERLTRIAETAERLAGDARARLVPTPGPEGAQRGD